MYGYSSISRMVSPFPSSPKQDTTHHHCTLSPPRSASTTTTRHPRDPSSSFFFLNHRHHHHQHHLSIYLLFARSQSPAISLLANSNREIWDIGKVSGRHLYTISSSTRRHVCGVDFGISSLSGISCERLLLGPPTYSPCHRDEHQHRVFEM